MNYIDEQTWKEYLGDSLDMFQMIGGSFIDSYKDFEERVNKAYSSNDMNTTLTEIHSLKGITLNLGMKALYESTKDGCEKIRGGLFTASDLSAILEVFNNTYSELSGLLNS